MPEILPRNPLRTYQFRIAVLAVGTAKPVDANYVAGVKSVSGLRTQVSAWETWEGGNNLHRYANPNKVTWEPVILEQGLALDTTFERWAQAVLDFAAGRKLTADEPVKRHVMIDVWDENTHPKGPPAPAQPLTSSPASGRLPVPITGEQLGPRFRRYHLQNAWISKYNPLAKLDSMTSEVALLSVELVHEGFLKEDIT
jgi:phage tail-like protein